MGDEDVHRAGSSAGGGDGAVDLGVGDVLGGKPVHALGAPPSVGGGRPAEEQHVDPSNGAAQSAGHVGDRPGQGGGFGGVGSEEGEVLVVAVDDPVVHARGAFIEDELQEFEVGGVVEAEVAGLDDRRRTGGHGEVGGVDERVDVVVEVADEGDAVRVRGGAHGGEGRGLGRTMASSCGQFCAVQGVFMSVYAGRTVWLFGAPVNLVTRKAMA